MNTENPRVELERSAATPSPESEAIAPPPEESGELKTQAAKAKEHWDQLVRTTADFENFKKRAARERQEAGRYANESLLQKLVPVLDNFEMALLAANSPQQTSAQSIQTGIQMIAQQLRQAGISKCLRTSSLATVPHVGTTNDALMVRA